jgi:nitrogen fixation protein FixH
VEAGVEGPFMTETMLGDQHLAVGVDPNQVGTNMVHLSLTTEEELPGKAEEIRVLFRMPSENIGPIEAMAESRGHGTFVVHGHQLSVPGEWTLEIVALIDRFTEERATVEIVVNP